MYRKLMSWNNSDQPKSPEGPRLNNWSFSWWDIHVLKAYLTWENPENLKWVEQILQLFRSEDNSWLTFEERGDRSWESILTVVLVVTLQSNKVPVVQPSHAVHPLTPLITYSDEHFSPGSHPSHAVLWAISSSLDYFTFIWPSCFQKFGEEIISSKLQFLNTLKTNTIR